MPRPPKKVFKVNATSKTLSWRRLGVAKYTSSQRDVGNFLVMLTPWLLAAALIDWWVTRTLSRFAIFIPKTPTMITGYQWLNWLGQAGSTVAAFLALLGVFYIVVVEWRARRGWLALSLAGLAVLTTLAPLFPPATWLPGYYMLAVAVLLALGWRTVSVASARACLALLLPVLAMLAAALYQAAPALYTVLHWPGPPAWGLPLFRLGEGLVVLGAAALWWVYGRDADRRGWLIGGMFALCFAATYHAAPAMTATIVIWSHGLTLSLPWWLYAAALLVFSVTVIHNLRNGQRMVAWALLLLAAAGYAPQLSSQFWFGVIGLWLLCLPPRVQVAPRASLSPSPFRTRDRCL
jgi:hypothetical protein